MKNISTIIILFLTLLSCRQNEKKKETRKVDYKIDIYGIYLGDNYKISDKIIGWSWASESDDDGVIDSTENDAFLHLGEPLIHYNNGEWLPSLFISTEKNIIKSFTCSVLFPLKNTAFSKADFLKILSKDIKQLQNFEISNSLIKTGKYDLSSKDYIEIFRLTEGKKDEYDTFEYTIREK